MKVLCTKFKKKAHIGLINKIMMVKEHFFVYINSLLRKFKLKNDSIYVS